MLGIVAKDISLEIVVVEQSKEATVEKVLKPDVKYSLAQNDGYYNRGWGFNVAARAYPNADYYFFADNDIILPFEDIINVFMTCRNYEAVNPYRAVYDTTEDIHESKKTIYGFSRKNETVTDMAEKRLVDGCRPFTCFSGGIVGISRKAFNDVSGWDERFRGRGWEDYAFSAKLQLFLTSRFTFPYDALHIYHPQETDTTKETNKALDTEYEGYTPTDYGKHIIDTQESFGNSKKYATEHASQDKFEFGLKNDEFNRRYVKALSSYGEIMALTEVRHGKGSDTLKIVYANLSDRHDCHKC